MPEPRHPVHTGGCQCGAARYALYAEPSLTLICHCRMCQKAFGSFFAPFASIALDQFAWTRGQATHYASSQLLHRGFCERCGTPLSCHEHGKDHINLSIGSFDAPQKLRPTRQYGIESRLPWLDQLATLPGKCTEDTCPPDFLAKLENRQHPDHDSQDWEPKG